MKTFKIHTLGCKVNTYESEAISELLIASSFKRVEEDEQAMEDYLEGKEVSVETLKKHFAWIAEQEKIADVSHETEITEEKTEVSQNTTLSYALKCVQARHHAYIYGPE